MKPVSTPLHPLRLLLVCLCLILWPGHLQAQSPSGWLPASWFSSADIDEKAMFPLAERDGPWLVLAMRIRSGRSAG